MLNWCNQFSICCFMNSHSYPDTYSSYDCLLAAGAITTFSPENNILPQLRTFTQQHQDWLFGHVSYDIKNEIEGLTSGHPDNTQFPLIFFFQPETVITIKDKEVVIECIARRPADIHLQIQEEQLTPYSSKKDSIALKSRISQKQYLAAVQHIQQHILRGDCYEINFCQEFFAEDSTINPLQVFQQLAAISPTPFAA